MLLSKRNLCNELKDLDMYGAGVEFNFQGKNRFTTVIGSIMTFITILLFISFAAIRTLEFALQGDPFINMTSLIAEEESIDLWDIDFVFAIEDLDPKVGRISVQQVSWNVNE